MLARTCQTLLLCWLCRLFLKWWDMPPSMGVSENIFRRFSKSRVDNFACKYITATNIIYCCFLIRNNLYIFVLWYHFLMSLRLPHDRCRNTKHVKIPHGIHSFRSYPFPPLPSWPWKFCVCDSSPDSDNSHFYKLWNSNFCDHSWTRAVPNMLRRLRYSHLILGAQTARSPWFQADWTKIMNIWEY